VESTQGSGLAVAAVLERFICDVGQVTPEDTGFTRQVHLMHEGYLDSYGALQLISYIEKYFQLQLSDGELSDPGFMTIDGMSGIIAAALARRGAT
jgi:acyl carrier protein